MVAVDCGPRMRCVSVLRAAKRSFVTVAVCSLAPPWTDQRVASGLWCHSHSWPKVGPVNVSRPVCGFIARGGRGTFGYGYDAPHAPLTSVTLGQPPASH